MSKAWEVNFDGLVGPTHNYSGLSFGNVASESHGKEVSNPREAAKQGLLKMKALHDRGFKQALLPPHERPNISMLRQLGYRGTDAEVLAKVLQDAPVILGSVSSASAMWTANAATVSPSADCADGKVHFTPANLTAKFHRSFEHLTTGRLLQRIFADERYFSHHPALPPTLQFGDEGAANHTRLCADYAGPGVELFVYGRVAFDEKAPRPMKYPARQTREACQAVQRLHQLPDERVVLAQQHPDVIDQGVFHNDVIAVGNGNLLFHHEAAFLDSRRVLDELAGKLAAQGAVLQSLSVSSEEVTVEDAVQSYLFNSQLLTLENGRMLLLVPGECAYHPRVAAYLQSLPGRGSPIQEVLVMDLKQSMKNGGGPACLRLRVALTASELQAVHAGVMFSDALFERLNSWVDRHYRDRLTLQDLADPGLLRESQTALDELTGILGLGSIYPFQLTGQGT
jgi:succinylarginine dihydrolase